MATKQTTSNNMTDKLNKKSYLQWIKAKGLSNTYVEALKTKASWDANGADFSMSCSKIPKKTLKLVKNKLEQSKIETGEMVKIKVSPILTSNMCWHNAEYVQKQLGGNIVYGFNIAACPCGSAIGFEIHCVNKINNVYYDFTQDFNNETSKWFIEIVNYNSICLGVNATQDAPREATTTAKCRCPITWNIPPFSTTYHNSLTECVNCFEPYYCKNFVDYINKHYNANK
tara:strand:- start:166 stop:849 length:684 start_codon:yes stop_codon:yes gene_type:complete